MSKVYVIAAVHGDEIFGLRVTDILEQAPTSNIRIRVGNPEAISKRTRFIETDLNRSFCRRVKSLEAELADAIELDVKQFKPDYIIDIHTSLSDVSKVAIVAKQSPATVELAKALRADAIVIMPRSIAEHSLIGRFPNNAVSLEFGKRFRSDRLASRLANKILGLVNDVQTSDISLQMFEVTSTIPKSYKGLVGIKNLIYNPGLGGYPFLAGSDTYESIGGFLAQKITNDK